MTDMSTNAQTEAEQFVFSDEWYEKGELEQLPALLQGARSFVDCGASVGPYTKCANEVISDGVIYAIEANPSNYAVLKANCEEWSALGRNTIQAVHCAVSNEDGEVEMLIPNEESALTGSIIAHEALRGTHEKVIVPAKKLDSVLQGVQPDLIKVDVEGVELRVLLGAQRIIEERHTKFLVEVHPWGDSSIGARSEHVFQFFREAGYGFRRVSRHWLFFPVKNLTGKDFLRYHGVELIMKHQWLRDMAREAVLLFRRLTGKN